MRLSHREIRLYLKGVKFTVPSEGKNEFLGDTNGYERVARIRVLGILNHPLSLNPLMYKRKKGGTNEYIRITNVCNREKKNIFQNRVTGSHKLKTSIYI